MNYIIGALRHNKRSDNRRSHPCYLILINKKKTFQTVLENISQAIVVIL